MIGSTRYTIICCDKKLIGVGAQLNGNSEKLEGDLVLPPNTYAGIGLTEAGGTLIQTNHPIGFDGFGPFNAAGSFAEFDSNGDLINTDISGNAITPNSIVRNKLREEAAKQKQLLEKLRRLLEAAGKCGLCSDL